MKKFAALRARLSKILVRRKARGNIFLKSFAHNVNPRIMLQLKVGNIDETLVSLKTVSPTHSFQQLNFHDIQQSSLKTVSFGTRRNIK